MIRTKGIDTESDGSAILHEGTNPKRSKDALVKGAADRKVTHWRDYLDPVAVFDAIGWPAHHK